MKDAIPKGSTMKRIEKKVTFMHSQEECRFYATPPDQRGPVKPFSGFLEKEATLSMCNGVIHVTAFDGEINLVFSSMSNQGRWITAGWIFTENDGFTKTGAFKKRADAGSPISVWVALLTEAIDTWLATFHSPDLARVIRADVIEHIIKM